MSKETGILLAGGLGLLLGAGLYGFRYFLVKKSRDYDDYYEDFHRHFIRPSKTTHDGVEYLAMQ